jgi:hypothetical protein
VILTATLIATGLWLLYRLLLAEGAGPLLAATLVLLAAVTASMHWLARPHLFTHLLVIVFLWQLRAFDRGRLSARALFAVLLPLMALWANTHGAFFTGLVLIGIHFAGAFLERRRAQARALAWLGVAAVLVTFLNPNGWRLHATVLGYLRDPALVGGVNEFLSPDFHTDVVRGFLLQWLALAGLLLVVRPRLGATDLCMIAVWTYFALHSVRNLPVFGFVVTPILAEHFQHWLQNVSPTRWRLYRRLAATAAGLEQRTDGRALVPGAVVALVALSAHAGLTTEILPTQFPVEAVRFVRAHPAAVPGNMYNVDSWGGYLMWALPERKVFIDSRHEFYGREFIGQYLQVASVKTNWAEPLDRYRVGWALVPTAHPLGRLLELHPGWRRVYSDHTATIFARP